MSSSLWRVCDAVGRVIWSLPIGELVLGVTSLDNHLYVLRVKKTSDQIEVYDIDTFHILLRLTVRGLNGPGDIVACGHNRCVYISDTIHKSVHRVALPDHTVTQWPVNDVPAGLSLTVTHGVLVTCFVFRKIMEFSTDGQLLHQLTLPEDFNSPLHSIQLSSGEFIVCHGRFSDPLHRVCLIDSDGSVVRSFSGPAGAGSQQIDEPAHMAVDRNGFVFVVDMSNSRVLLLSPTLTNVRELVFGELDREPQSIIVRVHVDSDRRRLYIADNDNMHFDDDDGTLVFGRVVVASV